MNAFDRAANTMLKNNLTLYLSLHLKRMPTEEEVFEEFMCYMDGKIKTDLEYRAIAYEMPAYKDRPDEQDLVDLGYYPKEERNEDF